MEFLSFAFHVPGSVEGVVECLLLEPSGVDSQFHQRCCSGPELLPVFGFYTPAPNFVLNGLNPRWDLDYHNFFAVIG